MLCQICNKKNATVHLTEIINDQMTEIHLCEACAKQKGVAGMGQPFGLQDLLAGLVDFGTPVAPGAKKTDVKCPNCKMTYEDFRKLGRLGCSVCYDTFKDTLDPLLKKVHGSVQHVGKAPVREGEKFQKKQERQDLQFRLQRAIQSEEFEEAARLRDKLRKLEKGKGEGKKG